MGCAGLIIHAMLLKAGILSLALLVASRVLGLARESAQAAAFGTSGLGDIAVLMLTLPDWLAGLFASGALAYVMLPYWARQPPFQQAKSQRLVAGWLLAGGGLTGVLLWLLQEQAVAVLAAGLPADLQSVARSAMGFSAIAVPFALLAALWATRLQHERDFTGMYAANLVVNVVLIGALASLAADRNASQAVQFLGFSLVVAMLLRLGWLGWRQHSQVPGAAAAQGTAEPLPGAAVWTWAALSAGLPLALPFVARSMASQGGEGELATFNYAWKLVELPLVLAIQLVASLSFPAIARAFAEKADAGVTVRQAFMLAWSLACAAVAGVLVGANAVAQLLFGWGRMTPDSVLRVADWATTGAWSLLPQAVIAVSMMILAIRQQMRRVVSAYALALAALVLAGAWTAGDGTRLMLLMNIVFSGVAVTGVWALGSEARGWVPWRAMAVPAAVLLVIWGLQAGLIGKEWNAGTLLGLVAAGLAACMVLISAWLASRGIRRGAR